MKDSVFVQICELLMHPQAPVPISVRSATECPFYSATLCMCAWMHVIAELEKNPCLLETKVMHWRQGDILLKLYWKINCVLVMSVSNMQLACLWYVLSADWGLRVHSLFWLLKKHNWQRNPRTRLAALQCKYRRARRFLADTSMCMYGTVQIGDCRM